MHVTKHVTILGEAYAIDCAPCDERRLEDLTRALEARLAGLSGDADAKRRLVLTALGLMDEVQATSAALVRARCEIERLTDMLVEARLEAGAPESEPPDRGGITSFRVAQGRA